MGARRQRSLLTIMKLRTEKGGTHECVVRRRRDVRRRHRLFLPPVYTLPLHLLYTSFPLSHFTFPLHLFQDTTPNPFALPFILPRYPSCHCLNPFCIRPAFFFFHPRPCLDPAKTRLYLSLTFLNPPPCGPFPAAAPDADRSRSSDGGRLWQHRQLQLQRAHGGGGSRKTPHLGFRVGGLGLRGGGLWS